MGAGIGFLLGAGMRHFGNEAQRKQQQKLLEQKTKADMEAAWFQAGLKDPNMMSQPAFQAFAEKYIGPEGKQTLQGASQAWQDFQQKLQGGGQAPSPITPVAPPSPTTQFIQAGGPTPSAAAAPAQPAAGAPSGVPPVPPRIAALNAEIQRVSALTPVGDAQKNIVKQRLDTLKSQLDEQWKQYTGSREYKADVAGAETTARKKAALEPPIVAAEAAAEATKAGARKRGELAVAGTPEALQLLTDQTLARRRGELQAEASAAGPIIKKIQSIYPGIPTKVAQDIFKSEIKPFTDEQAQLRGALLQVKQIQRFMDKANLTGSDVGRSYYRKIAPQKLLRKDEQQLSNYLSALEAVTVPAYLKRTRLGQTALEWFRQHVPKLDDTYDLMRMKTDQLTGFLSVLARTKDPFITDEELTGLDQYMAANPAPSAIEQAPATGTAAAAAQPAPMPTPTPGAVSKSGKRMVRDPKSPSGWSYAE